MDTRRRGLASPRRANLVGPWWWPSLSVSVAIVAVMVTCATAVAATGAVRPYVTTRGVHFVDRAGGVVVLRGVDISDRSAHLDKVVEVGANFVRLRVLWAHAQPSRGGLDARELLRLDRAVSYFSAHHINIELDLRGRPAPEWFGSTKNFFSTNRVASQHAYLGFVLGMVRRYDTEPYVIGYGIFNEPEPYSWNGGGFGTPLLDRRMLRWQAPIRDAILATDPYRAVFLNVRGGNYGMHTCFRCVGFRLAHIVIDWHDFYNGCCGTGMDENDDNWIPNWAATHNQRSTDYHGTTANQWANLAIPWQRSHALGIPMIVGEWGVRNDDDHATVYDEQMEQLLNQHGISWARWDMDGNSPLGLITNGRLNAQGKWLQGELLGGE